MLDYAGARMDTRSKILTLDDALRLPRGTLTLVSGGFDALRALHVREFALLQRPILDGERVEVGKHPPEHPWIVVAEVSVECFPGRMAACGAVAGPGRDRVRHRRRL